MHIFVQKNKILTKNLPNQSIFATIKNNSNFSIKKIFTKDFNKANTIN